MLKSIAEVAPEKNVLKHFADAEEAHTDDSIRSKRYRVSLKMDYDYGNNYTVFRLGAACLK